MFRSAVLCMALFLVGCGQGNPSEANLENTEAIKGLYEDYRTAWLRNDDQTESLVMAIFLDDATIIPSGGTMIFTGTEEIKGFWFPPDAPPSTVDLFEQEVVKITVNGDQGTLVGRFRMIFSDETGSYYTQGNRLLVAVQENGQWKISTLIWNHPPWELVKKE